MIINRIINSKGKVQKKKKKHVSFGGSGRKFPVFIFFQKVKKEKKIGGVEPKFKFISGVVWGGQPELKHVFFSSHLSLRTTHFPPQYLFTKIIFKFRKPLKNPMNFNGFEETFAIFNIFFRKPSPLNVFWYYDH